MVKHTGTPPKGVDLLATLLDLLAEQEGVTIAYELQQGEEVRKKGTFKDESRIVYPKV